jgi:type IV pilus assembly protein PilF
MNIRYAPVCILLCLSLAACATSGQPTGVKARIAAQSNTQLGIEYIRQKNYELAKDRLEKALEEEPDYALAHQVTAILYDRIGDSKEAEKHYRTALRLDPGNAEGHNNYGQFLCSHERYEEADKEYLIAAKNPYNKTPQVALLNAGMCMTARHNAAAAEKYYRLALDKDPDFAPALYKMAELNFNAQHYLKARAWLQRYGEVGEQTPQSLWLGVRTESELGDRNASENYALRLRGKFPQSDEATLLEEWEHERRPGN